MQFYKYVPKINKQGRKRTHNTGERPSVGQHSLKKNFLFFLFEKTILLY